MISLMANKNFKVKRVSKEINITEESIVTKSNELVEARYRLSLREQRFVLLMVSMIEPEDEDFTYYEIPARDLIKHLGLEKEHDAYKRVRKLVRGMQTRILTIDEDGGPVDVVWVASAKYGNDSVVSFEFSRRLKPYLLQLSREFTTYKLMNVVRLQSSHAIRIYELLKRYERIGRRTIQLDDLRLTLGIEDSSTYALYGNIKSKILLPAQREIARHTDISFTFDEIKRGRKVVELRFMIKPNKSKQSLLPAPDAETEPTMVKEMRRAKVSKHEANKIWEGQWDFLDKEARKTVEPLIAGGLQFDQYVRDKLFLLESAQKQKKVPSTGGFLRDAIKQNWTNGDQETRRKTAQQKAHFQQRVREEDTKRQRKDEEQRNQRMREVQLEARYIALSPTQQKKVNEQVYARLLERDELSAYRVQVERASSAVDSPAFFEALPSGTRVIAKSIMRELVAIG